MDRCSDVGRKLNRRLISIAKGILVWTILKIRYRLNYDKVLLILPEADYELNYYALAHLGDFLKRRHAKEALVLVTNPETLNLCMNIEMEMSFRCKEISIEKVDWLLSFYCYWRFFDNAVFVLLNKPQDNISDKIIGTNGITKEELVCLGHYCLRCVPELHIKL